MRFFPIPEKRLNPRQRVASRGGALEWVRHGNRLYFVGVVVFQNGSSLGETTAIRVVEGDIQRGLGIVAAERRETGRGILLVRQLGQRPVIEAIHSEKGLERL